MSLTLTDLTGGGTTARRELPNALVRAADSDKRTVTGVGVPYGEELVTPWFRERFEPGACDDDAEALAYWRHSDPIGVLASARDTDAGREVTLRLSQTATADEALTLARDGVIRSLSIGFEPIEWREEHDEDEDVPLIVHTKVRVREYSLVPFPAYETASISSVRDRDTPKENPVPENTNLPADLVREADLTALGDQLRSDMQDAVRTAQLAGAGDGSTDRLSAASEFRGLGDFIKTLASSDAPAERRQLAQQLYRDVVTTDVPALQTGPGFVGDLTRRIQARRRWINRFTTKPLPAKGMTVDYARRTGSATVAEQENQLDPLAKGSKFGMKPASAKVRTFGGAETVSQQVIDRIPEDQVAAIFEAFAYAYAEETDQAMQAHVVAELDAQLAAGTNTLDMPASPGAFDWIAAVVDAAEHFDGTAYAYSELAVSSDIFKALASEAGTDGRPLLSLHSGSTATNVVGTLNLPAIEGNLLNVPVRLLSGTIGRALFMDTEAFAFYESPGAPFRLQQDQILNLSRDLAVYGYGAFTTPHPEAILPVSFATGATTAPDAGTAE